MAGRVTRLAAAVAVAVAAGGAGIAASVPTANATPAPIVVGSCHSTVQGAPGTPVSLSPNAVLDVVPVLGRLVPRLPAIPIGAIPTGGGYISGGTIAGKVAATVADMPLVGTVIGSVQSLLTSACGVTMKAVNDAAAPVQQGADRVDDTLRHAVPRLPGSDEPPADPPGAGQPDDPGTVAHQPSGDGQTASPPTAPLGMPDYDHFVGHGVPYHDSLVAPFASAISPAQRYGDLPFATSGLFAPSPGVRYGGQVPGYAPQFGVLGHAPDGTGPGTDVVRTAGHAEALSSGGGRDVGLPLLLAVLALAAVSGGLVRAVVARRAGAARQRALR